MSVIDFDIADYDFSPVVVGRKNTCFDSHLTNEIGENASIILDKIKYPRKSFEAFLAGIEKVQPVQAVIVPSDDCQADWTRILSRVAVESDRQVRSAGIIGKEVEPVVRSEDIGVGKLNKRKRAGRRHGGLLRIKIAMTEEQIGHGCINGGHFAASVEFLNVSRGCEGERHPLFDRISLGAGRSRLLAVEPQYRISLTGSFGKHRNGHNADES